MNYLLNTNMLIDFTNNLLPVTCRRIITSVKPAISFITRIEVFAWASLSTSEENSLKQFINRSNVYGCSEAIILQTIAIRKQYKLNLPDAMIAATAVVHNLTLLTRNVKDFKSVSNLTIIDPHTF